MINPLWLNSFCGLVANGHFTRTAQQLNMTQSGVSQHIRKLEEQIGVPLLDRKGKGFELTDAGKRLYTEAQKIILALSNLEQTITADPPFEGIVKIMSPGSIGLKLYQHLLQLQVCHPQLIIDYRFASNRDIEKAVVSKHIDFGLLTNLPNEAGLDCKPIGKESLLLVTPSAVTHPSWEQLNKLGFINHPDGSHHANLLLSANYPEFKHIREFMQKGFSNQIGLILLPVSMGLGFTVLPSYAVENFAEPHLIAVSHLQNSVAETIYLATHHSTSRPNRVKSVLAEISKTFARD